MTGWNKGDQVNTLEQLKTLPKNTIVSDSKGLVVGVSYSPGFAKILDFPLTIDVMPGEVPVPTGEERMSDYTPTTDDIKSIWRSRYDSEHHWAVGEELRGYEAEFDRWLEQVRAEAWEEGHEAAAMRIPEGVWHDVAAPHPTNPYRQEKNA